MTQLLGNVTQSAIGSLSSVVTPSVVTAPTDIRAGYALGRMIRRPKRVRHREQEMRVIATVLALDQQRRRALRAA